jgi:hypothetical protein
MNCMYLSFRHTCYVHHLSHYFLIDPRTFFGEGWRSWSSLGINVSFCILNTIKKVTTYDIWTLLYHITWYCTSLYIFMYRYLLRIWDRSIFVPFNSVWYVQKTPHKLVKVNPSRQFVIWTHQISCTSVTMGIMSSFIICTLHLVSL